MTDQTGDRGAEAGRQCRWCGSHIRPGARFCPACGQVAAAMGPPAARDPGPKLRRRRPGAAVALWVGVAAVAVGALVTVLVTEHPFSSTPVASNSSAAGPNPGPSVSRSSSSPAPTPLPSTSSPAPTPTVDEATAASNLAGLLAESSDDRQAVNSAVTDASECGSNLAGDPSVFQNAATSRRKLLAQLTDLPGRSTLPPAMLADLTAAWRASVKVNDDYARWTQDEVSSGCSTDDPNLVAASTPNGEATFDKSNFLYLWNPLARNYGLRTYQQDEI